jgi:hypothetical protein
MRCCISGFLIGSTVFEGVITSKVARTKRGVINEGGMRNTPDNETGERRKWEKWIKAVWR